MHTSGVSQTESLALEVFISLSFTCIIRIYFVKLDFVMKLVHKAAGYLCLFGQ